MAKEGVSAALKLDDGILTDLQTAQGYIEAMRTAAEGLANQFSDVATRTASITNALKGSGLSLKTTMDADGAVKDIQVVADAAVKAGQKASAVKKEFDFTEEINRTREKMYELQRIKIGMDRRDIGFSHAEYVKLGQDIDALKAKLQTLLEARRNAFSGDPSKQAAGEFKEYISSLTSTNDGLKKMNAYYRELEKSSARVAKEQKYVADIQDRATAALSMNPKSVDEMIAKLNELKAVKRQLEAESKKTGVIDPSVLQKVNTQIANTEAGIKRVNERMKETSKMANTVRSMLMTAFSPFLVQRFLSEMLKVRGEFELSQKSLAVIIQDANKASSMFNEITQIAVKSPFSVQDILKQTKQLAAYRIETDKLIETTKMLGDISAGVGVDMNRLILAYGQVKAAEFLKGTELRQFSEAGVNMLGGLAKRFTELYGRVVSVGEVMQMVSKRMVKFADVEAVLKEATEVGGAFYKMQEQQAETIQGRISNLNDRIQIMFNNIGKSHDATIKGIITGLENIISHWQAISAIVEPLLGMMLIRGTLGLVGMSKLGRSIREEYSLQLGLARLQGVELGKIKKGMAALGSVARGVGNILKNNWLTIAIYVAAVIVDLIAKANQFRKTVKEIANDASTSVNDQVNKYERLLDIAVDVNNKETDRQKALDKLKTEYGNILDIQKIELSNINELNDARQRSIELIRLQAYEEARQKAINEAMSESQKKAGKRAEEIAKQVRQGQGAGYSIDRQAVDLGIQMLDDSDFAAIEAHVSDAILNGTIKGSEEAGKEVIKAALKMADRTEAEIEETIGSLSPVYLKTVGTAFNQVIRQADVIDGLLSNVPGEIAAKAAAPYKDLIKTLSSARKDFDKLYKNPEYEYNPALKEIDYNAYLQGLVDEIKNTIDNGGLGEISEATKEGLNKQLIQAFNEASNVGGEVEQAIRKVQSEVAKKYKKIGRAVIGQGLLKYEEGQSTKDYIDSIDKELKDAIKVAAEWDKLQDEIRAGHTGPRPPRLIELAQMFGSKEELQVYIKMIEELKAALGGTTTVNPSGGNGADSQKQKLNSFITALKNARREMNKLTGEGDTKYIEKLVYLGEQAGVSLGSGFKATNEEIIKLIDKYKDKLAENDRIDLELSIITDNAEHQLSSFQNLAKDLWDRYDNSKKLEEWGFFPDEGTTKEVMGEIMGLENYLREKAEKEGNEESLKLANELKERRIQIARSEAEEAAKLMYEANKKALDKVGQAYKSMSDDIKKIREGSNQGYEVTENAVNNRIKKGLKEVADAQWDAYKGSQEYALALGDVDGLGKDVLASLKQSLEYWRSANKESLSATEIRTIERALKKINEALKVEPVKSYFGALANGFNHIKKARDLAETFKDLRRAVVDAEEEVSVAQADRDAMSVNYELNKNASTLEALEGAERDLKAAEEKRDTAVQNLKDAQADYNSELETSAKKLSEIEKNYNGLSDVFGKAISLATDSIEALGGEIDDVTSAGIDGIKTALSLVGNAISLGKGAVEVFGALEKAETIFGIAKSAVLGPFLAAVFAIGTALAILKMRDAALEKQVENHKKNVERLEKAYEKLEKAMNKALDLGDARQSYAEMNANLAKQRQELEEAIEANDRRKQTEKVKDETEEMREQLNDLDEKVEESRDKWFEMLGAVTDYQNTARDWASDWLDAFKETGDGLDSLKENFDELYDNLVVGQLWTKIMGPKIKALEQMVGDAIGDGELTESEAAALRAFKTTFATANEDLKKLAESLGIKGGQLNGETLQRGVETITETTASALESILNATRYDVSSTNVYVANIAAALTGEGDNTILSNLRSQTRYLADIARIASAVYYPGGHSKGAGALKVIADVN